MKSETRIALVALLLCGMMALGLLSTFASARIYQTWHPYIGFFNILLSIAIFIIFAQADRNGASAFRTDGLQHDIADLGWVFTTMCIVGAYLSPLPRVYAYKAPVGTIYWNILSISPIVLVLVFVVKQAYQQNSSF